jgi:hypothetical protein
MLDAFGSVLFAFLRETLPSFLRQTLPSLCATLSAAVLIAGYNHTFHLSSPRMSALESMGSPAAPARTAAQTTAQPSTTVASQPSTTVVSMTKPPPKPVTEYITIHEVVADSDRRPQKELKGELGKDQSKEQPVAKAPVPAPRPVASAPRAEPPRVTERRAEPRPTNVAVAQPMTAAPLPAPLNPPVVIAAPAPVIGPPPVGPGPMVMQPSAVPLEPPPVVAGRPYVTVPDRPYQQQRPTYEANADDLPPPPPRGPLGMIVDTFRPSALFARAREFGEKIEQTGNDILPNIRPQ